MPKIVQTAALLLCLAWTMPVRAQAQNPTAKAPEPAMVKATWDYFYSGQGGGPVLADLKVCTEVGKDGPNKFECAAEVPAEGVKAGTSVYVWQAYLIPQGDTVEDLAVQLKLGDTVRETKDVKVKGEAWRARTWTALRLPKAGTWTINVLRGNDVLKTLTVKAF